jgi:hypothetical protein
MDLITYKDNEYDEKNMCFCDMSSFDLRKNNLSHPKQCKNLAERVVPI